MSDKYLFLSVCAGLAVEVTDVCSTLQELYILLTQLWKNYQEKKRAGKIVHIISNFTSKGV